MILRCFVVRIWLRLDSNRALRDFLAMDYYPYNRRIRRDRNEHLPPRKLTDTGSDLHEPGSMPAILMTAAAADEVRNLNNTLAASGSLAVVTIPAEITFMA